MQELGRFNVKINLIPKGLEQFISFSIKNKVSFVGSFQFLSLLLDTLVKNLSIDDFKYLSQEFDNNVLDVVKKKGFYSDE